jgi:transposase
MTSNHAERTVRFAVLCGANAVSAPEWEKGNTFVERILSLGHTCRLRGRRTFSILVDAMQAYLLGMPANIS